MSSVLINVDLIATKILFLRSEKVLLDQDLATLYGVETKQLKRQVRRNISRFPSDFMFQLTAQGYSSLWSQIGTLNRGGHSKYLLYAFTEQGVAILSAFDKSTLGGGDGVPGFILFSQETTRKRRINTAVLLIKG